jgi:hypothetical protein
VLLEMGSTLAGGKQKEAQKKPHPSPPPRGGGCVAFAPSGLPGSGGGEL